MGKKLNKVRQLCRAWHRDLGYFLIGACIIYGLSGMALSLKRYNVNFLSVKEAFSSKLSPSLSQDSLQLEWRNSPDKLPGVRGIKAASNGYDLELRSGEAHYDATTGLVSGYTYTPTDFLRLLHRMHFNGQGSFKIMGIFFAFALLFLAVSGAIIVTGKKGFMHRGIWFMIGGIAVVGLLALFTF